MKHRHAIFLLLAFPLSAVTAEADLPAPAATSADSSLLETPVPETNLPPPPGAITRQWLQRQRQGSGAAAVPQPLSGPVLEQIHERYRKSFSHPIPERFETERMNKGNGN